jgi:hypothetical protein
MLLKATSSMPAVTTKADWIEASCLFGKDISVSRTDASVALESSYGEDEDRINSFVEDTFGELERRKNLTKDYPFEVYSNKISRVGHWWEHNAYSFLLLLSTNHFYKQTRLTNENRGIPAKLFEALTSSAVNKYLPATLNIGWPRITPPKDLDEALQFFCEISYESMREKPEIADKAKDEDVDIIAWAPLDKRAGQIVLLVQCTIEKDWRRSAAKIDPATWKNIINFATTPRKALAFPQVCGLEHWKYQSTKSGILFDRLRLVSLFQAGQPPYPNKTLCLTSKILEWSIEQAEKLQWFA